MRLALASAVTLGLLFTLLFAVLGGLAVFFEVFNFYVVVIGVVLVNFVVWLVSPKISDFIYSYFYDMRWVSLEDLKEVSPQSARLIEVVTGDYDYSLPKLGIIEDSNPQAFTYGSGRWNSRIIVTEGIFQYLDENETAAVYGHELGHITNRDFIIMTVANTIVQLLYLVGTRLLRSMRGNSRGGKGKGLIVGIAVVSYVFYIIGKYLVYYLSRVREYYADKFSARYMDPNYLSSALLKISYGILDSPDNEDLVNATESMGIMDFKEAQKDGQVYYSSSNLQNWDYLSKAFLFDIKNPWAFLMELKSTHPLTGKRIRALSRWTDEPMFDFEVLERRFDVDKGRLYRQFFKDLAVVTVPKLLLILMPVVFVLGLYRGWPWVPNLNLFLGLWLGIAGFGGIIKTLYRYPPEDKAENTSVLELLSDIYASPVRGSKGRLRGRIIGRGRAGFKLGKDLKLQDETGLMYLRYKSIIPFFGDLWFGWRRAKKLIDEDAEIEGWFLRGTSPWTGLKKIWTRSEEISSWMRIHGIVIGLILLFLAVVSVLFLPVGLI